MRSTRRITAIAFALVFQFTMSIYGQDVSSYLIVNDISGFTVSGDPARGKGPGILAGADHFYLDHADITYEIDYFNLQTKVGSEIQVTKHDGSESDKWLLHEVEKGFRDADDEEDRLGQLHKGSRLVDINGNKVLRYWSAYSWLSDNVVVTVDYSDPRKPEPLIVVQAYVQKFPSSIAGTFTLDRAHDITWIKDEMDRRLWLCDKWFYQLQLSKVQQAEALQAAVKSMNIFLDYREKYYGVKAIDEKNILAGYLNGNNGTGIKAKLDEYKKWWAVNKSGAINL